MIMSQGIGFFIAGFETSSNTMSTLCYNLAMNPEVQEKMYQEICSVTEDNNGIIDHETIGHMNYLEVYMCVGILAYMATGQLLGGGVRKSYIYFYYYLKKKLVVFYIEIYVM
jgi:hypothetical protein